MINIIENISLKPFNTFGIGAIADYYIAFSSVEQLEEALRFSSDQPRLILGGGSNILLCHDFEGTVLHNQIKGISLTHQDDDFYYVKANAGEVWHDFVMHCIAHNYQGVENLSLIPGSVGASPMQNIGAYGIEIKDLFYQLEAYEIATGHIQTFTLNDCEFGYRTSVFKTTLKDKYIILNVTYRLRKQPVYNVSYGAIQQELAEMGVTELSAKAISDAVIAIRSSKLPNPAEIGNAGSFFKNPVISIALFEQIQQNYPEIVSYAIDEMHVKVAAGWLIEAAGWKGKTLGNYGVHKKQALVLVNYGGAKGKDIYELSQQIIEDIYYKFGIELEREVNIL